MIQLQKVSKVYKDGCSLIFGANELDLNIKKGDFISIIGPSGSGKTSLLSIIGCLIRPSSGKVMIDGRDTSELSDDELSIIRATKIGFVFQAAHVIPTMTLLENVLLPLVFLKDKDLAEKTERAKKLIKEVGLLDRMDSIPRNMSGGQIKRISIARALINNPEILLADEPTGDLDAESSKDIVELLKRINKEEGVTVLLVTHNAELAKDADVKLKMTSGKLTSL